MYCAIFSFGIILSLISLVIPKHTTEIGAPQKCDVVRFFSCVPSRLDFIQVVSETLGSFALEENLIPNMEEAKRFLREGGVLIPGRLQQFVAPVVRDEYENIINSWQAIKDEYGFDFSVLRDRSYQACFQLPIKSEHLLSESAAICFDSIDFYAKNEYSRPSKKVLWKVSKKRASVYGLCLWWTAELVPGILLSTAPTLPTTHWEQVYLPLRQPIELVKGDKLSATITATWNPKVAGTELTWHAEKI